MWAIHSLIPAPWGEHYRLVESFDTKEDAEKVLKCLESVNILFNSYKIIHWEEKSKNESINT